MHVSRQRRAYSLVELLIVIAILTILAALLFPVFSAAKMRASQAVCASNMHQANLASSAYLGDYDDRFMPVSQHPQGVPTSRNDRTWVQTLLPYARNFSVFLCPGDTSPRSQSEVLFDRDLVPGDLDSRYYTASTHVNFGLNYMALSPVVRIDSRWQSLPRSYSEILDPSAVAMYVDSVWAVDRMGRPIGGGNWLVEPPCRYLREEGKKIDAFAAYGRSFDKVFSTRMAFSSDSQNEGLRYGGAWPWHTHHMNVLRPDGSIHAYSPEGLNAGCDASDGEGGTVTSPHDYLWLGSY